MNTSFWIEAGLAMAAGALLNLTPCVLPAVPIKVRTILREAGDAAGSRALSAVLFTLGSVSFFAALGLLTALLALPVGYGLAWVLIEVVNPRAFGWRLAFEAAPLHAVTALLLAPVCGALASWYAARRVV